MPLDITGITIALSRRQRDAARRKLAKDRAENIVGNLCALTRAALEDGRLLTRARWCISGKVGATWGGPPSDQKTRRDRYHR